MRVSPMRSYAAAAWPKWRACSAACAKSRQLDSATPKHATCTSQRACDKPLHGCSKHHGHAERSSILQRWEGLIMISQSCRAICCGSMGILRQAAGHGSRPGGLPQSRRGQGWLPELPRAVHQMSAWCGRAGSRALSLRNQPQIPARQSHTICD